MKRMFLKEIRCTLFFQIAFLFVFCTLTACAPMGQQVIDSRSLYITAVKDSMTIEPEEILPLINLASSPLVTYNESKDKILLVTWHKYPESYEKGAVVTLKYGEVWTFTDKEIQAWLLKNKENVQNWDLRIKQLLGLPETSQYTHFTGFWVNKEDILRPAYNANPYSDILLTKFEKDIDKDFKAWFDGNIVYSYFESQYPWTRLGYTYDWADNGTEYGLTEFLVKKDALVEVEYTMPTQDFIYFITQ